MRFSIARFAPNLIAVLLCTLAEAQPVPPPPAPDFRVDTTLGTVRFHVMRGGKYVDDIRQEDVDLRVDGLPVPITVFEGGKAPRKTPLEIIFLFDCSGSMKHGNVLKPLAFKAGLLDPFEHVSISMYGFSSGMQSNNVKRFTAGTRDLAELQAAMKEVSKFGGGGTLIYHSILVLLYEAARRPSAGYRMMVIVSDGLSLAHLRKETVEAARILGIPLYPVLRKFSMDDVRPLLPYSVDTDPKKFAARVRKDFTNLAGETGGREFLPAHSEKNLLQDILKMLAEAVKTEYVVGFNPTPSGERKLHVVSVQLRSPELGVVQGGSRFFRY